MLYAALTHRRIYKGFLKTSSSLPLVRARAFDEEYQVSTGTEFETFRSLGNYLILDSLLYNLSQIDITIIIIVIAISLNILHRMGIML